MSAYLGYLLRRHYPRALLAAYAFLVFLGVMPKPPPRGPFQSELGYMAETVSRSLAGFATLALVLAVGCALWAVIAALRGSKAPDQPVPDQAQDGGPL
jgi:hypothetical protein